MFILLPACVPVVCCQNTGQTKLSDTFVGKVVEVASGDTLVVKDINAGGAERRISLSRYTSHAAVLATRLGGLDWAGPGHTHNIYLQSPDPFISTPSCRVESVALHGAQVHD